MESRDEKFDKIDIKLTLSKEGIFHDVIPEIFQYLNAKDLCRAAGVCSSWNEAVQEEISRRTIQSLPIKVMDDETEEDCDRGFEIHNSFKYSKSKTHLSNYLRNIPNYSLIFFDDKFENSVEPSDRLLHRYAFEVSVSNNSVTEILGASIDKTPILGTNNHALGIFIPSHSRLRIKTHVPYYEDIIEYPDENPNLTTEILKYLIGDSEDHHCIIIFNLILEYDWESDVGKVRRFTRDILSDLRKEYKPGKFSLWGGSVRSMKVWAPDVFSDVESCWFGMSLAGPTLVSHSIAIDENLPDSKKEEKLKDFKLSITMKAKTTALAFVPVNNSDSVESNILRTEAFRKVFPKLSSTCVYNTNELPQFSIDTTNDDPHLSLEFKNCIAYLIVSHT